MEVYQNKLPLARVKVTGSPKINFVSWLSGVGGANDNSSPCGPALIIDHVIAYGVPADVGHVGRALHHHVWPHHHDRLSCLGAQFYLLMALPAFDYLHTLASMNCCPSIRTFRSTRARDEATRERKTTQRMMGDFVIYVLLSSNRQRQYN